MKVESSLHQWHSYSVLLIWLSFALPHSLHASFHGHMTAEASHPATLDSRHSCHFMPDAQVTFVPVEVIKNNVIDWHHSWCKVNTMERKMQNNKINLFVTIKVIIFHFLQKHQLHPYAREYNEMNVRQRGWIYSSLHASHSSSTCIWCILFSHSTGTFIYL